MVGGTDAAMTGMRGATTIGVLTGPMPVNTANGPTTPNQRRIARPIRRLIPHPGLAYSFLSGDTCAQLQPGTWQRYTTCFPPVGIGGSTRKDPPMKPGIHPPYHDVTIVMTDGTTFKTKTCAGKPGETMRLDIDPKSHPAWTGVQRMMDTGGQVAKFNKKFAGIGTRK